MTLHTLLRSWAAAILSMLAAAGPVAAQADHEQLVAAAKKEGRVMAYGELITPTWRAFKAGFEKAYPGITMEFVYQSGQPMMTRILAEQDAGRHVADVLALDVLRLPILREKGYLAQYLSRESRNYDKQWQSDPPGYWTENHVYLGGIMYNKKLVPPDKAPKSFEDLLKPEWKGKIAMVSPVANDLIFYMFAGLVRDMGEERAFRFFRALKDQGALVFGPGGIRVSQGVNTGEFSIGVGFIGHVYSVGGGDSGNMAFVPTNPTYALSGPGVCVMKNAPHPNAARLLADYMNSREAQEIVVDLGYFSSFRGLQAKSALTKLNVSVAPTPQGEKKDRLQERIKDALGL
jgi:iron(III) transport system substrate-binding protein